MRGKKHNTAPHTETHYHLVVELHPYFDYKIYNQNLGLGCGLSTVASLCVVTIP